MVLVCVYVFLLLLWLMSLETVKPLRWHRLEMEEEMVLVGEIKRLLEDKGLSGLST